MTASRLGLSIVMCGFALALAGCAEEDEEGMVARSPDRVEVRCAEIPHATPDDSFWLAQAISDANKPPARPPRQTISLGYAGDEPLSGSVTRDSPVRPYVDPLAGPFSPWMDPPSYSHASRYGGGYYGRRVYLAPQY